MSAVLAAVMPEPNVPVELREFVEPELQPGSALLEVELSQVCGTDVHLQQGQLADVPIPMIPGHVSIGRLEKIRGELLDVHGQPFAEGETRSQHYLERNRNRSVRLQKSADASSAMPRELSLSGMILASQDQDGCGGSCACNHSQTKDLPVAPPEAPTIDLRRFLG